MNGYTKMYTICGSDFEPNDGESAARFRDRKTCGARSCRRTLAEVNRTLAAAEAGNRWARDPLPIVRQGACVPGKKPTTWRNMP